MSVNHLDVLLIAIKELEPLNEDLVYTGGSIISTLLTEHIHIDLRPTTDVDCIVQAQTRLQYEHIAKKLRSIGFNEDSSTRVICRFKKGKIFLDLMPTEENIFGFSNRWYQEAYRTKISNTINSVDFYSINAPCFIATKFEAFNGRGQNSPSTSHDIEDIITIFDGRKGILEEIVNAPKALNKYLIQEITRLLSEPFIGSIIRAHISDRNNLDLRADVAYDRMLESTRI